MSGESFGAQIRRIRNKWRQVEPSLYWGDNLDVRYYLCRRIRELREKSVLDIGCGPGIVLSELHPSNRLFGMDILSGNIRLAAGFNPRARLLVGDMHRLPFKKESFDVIMLNAMLPLAEDKRQLIAGIHELLRPQGTLYLTTHNRRYHAYRREVTLPTIAEIQEFLRPNFVFRVCGFNPLPRFPFGPPNALADKIPFVWPAIVFSAERGICRDISCGIYAEATRKAARR